ncbi:MAG: ParB/RepB/Spo0J family partition protein [Patescibacteria group bacterium]|jgi:ParB family chromosome partitioning protein|nr:ParB/RepB/Spo0J family partition protein [Patescibacteria group bacterium]
MAKPQGLGKGLGSLIPPKIDKQIIPQDSKILISESIAQVPINKIKANPLQPRSSFDHESLEELTNSIKEHGILQPLILVPSGDNYEVIAGERRLRASQILELKTVPAIIRNLAEQQKLELALVENIQRKDLTPIEEAVAYQRLIDEFSLTQEEAAKRVGKSRSAVTNILRLLTLPTEIQKALASGKINFSTARLIVGLPPQERLKFFQKVLKQDLTVRAAENQAKKIVVRRHVRRAKDPNITALEDRLQAALGTKVNVKKSGESGQIVIEFFSSEELDNLVSRLSG